MPKGFAKNEDAMEPKDRRKFLGEAAALASLSLFPAELLGQLTPQQKDALAGGPTWSQFQNLIKVVDWDPVDLRDGQEITWSFEIKGQQVRGYLRRVNVGNTYVLFQRIGLLNGKTLIAVINGTKGQEEGGYRLDSIQITRLEPDGTAVRQQPSVVRVLPGSLYAGLTPQQTIDRFLEDKAEGRVE
jgi:hypothetical protein